MCRVSINLALLDNQPTETGKQAGRQGGLLTWEDQYIFRRLANIKQLWLTACVGITNYPRFVLELVWNISSPYLPFFFFSFLFCIVEMLFLVQWNPFEIPIHLIVPQSDNKYSYELFTLWVGWWHRNWYTGQNSKRFKLEKENWTTLGCMFFFFFVLVFVCVFWGINKAELLEVNTFGSVSSLADLYWRRCRSDSREGWRHHLYKKGGLLLMPAFIRAGVAFAF